MSALEVRAEQTLSDAAPEDRRESDADADVREFEDESLPEAPETDLAADTDLSAGEADADNRPADRRLDTSVDRAALLERIRRSRTLPQGLRQRLCEFVETLQLSEDAPSVPAVPVAAAVEMFEAAIPAHLQLAGDHLDSPPHPRGENFFTGAGEAVTDADAERIASEQLAATGFAARNAED